MLSLLILLRLIFVFSIRPNVLEERGHILAHSVSKSSDPYRAEIGSRGEIQGTCFTPSGVYEQFTDAGMLVSGASATNSSRQAVDGSWQLQSSALCNGSAGETAVHLRPEDWANAPAFVPGQKWQFRSKLSSFNRKRILKNSCLE